MKFLALDTSGPAGSVAVMEDDRPLAELVLPADRKHGEQLAQGILSLLDQLGMKPADLAAYAVGLGPGSFTGLRTSLSLLKGMAIAEPRPVIGVSSLMALAAGVSDYSGLLLPITDARKGEVFAALFRADGRGKVSRESEDVAVAPLRLPELVNEKVLVLGDGLLRYCGAIEQAFAGKAVIADPSTWQVRAASIALLALPRLQQNDTDPVDALEPIYVRSSDIELKLGQKRK